jgi:hypothetical protein
MKMRFAIEGGGQVQRKVARLAEIPSSLRSAQYRVHCKHEEWFVSERALYFPPINKLFFLAES